MGSLNNPIAIMLPCDSFELVKALIPEFDDNNYYPPLKRGDKTIALLATGRVSDNTLEQINSQIESGSFKENTIHFFLLDWNRRVLSKTEYSPEMEFFESDLVLDAMDLDFGVAGQDCLQPAIDSTEQEEPLILSMLGEISIISAEPTDE